MQQLLALVALPCVAWFGLVCLLGSSSSIEQPVQKVLCTPTSCELPVWAAVGSVCSQTGLASHCHPVPPRLRSTRQELHSILGLPCPTSRMTSLKPAQHDLCSEANGLGPQQEPCCLKIGSPAKLLLEGCQPLLCVCMGCLVISCLLQRCLHACLDLCRLQAVICSGDIVACRVSNW